MKKLFSSLLLVLMMFILVSCKSNLTDAKLQDIINEKKIENLNWDDFSGFYKQVDKTKDKVWVFQLDNGSTLFLIGDKDSEKPHSISIVETDGRTTFLKNDTE